MVSLGLGNRLDECRCHAGRRPPTGRPHGPAAAQAGLPFLPPFLPPFFFLPGIAESENNGEWL